MTETRHDGRSTDERVRAVLRERCYAVVLPGATVEASDDFFALGGDSLRLIRLVALAQDVFDVEVDAVDFFVEPTLGTLAELIAQRVAVAAAT